MRVTPPLGFECSCPIQAPKVQAPIRDKPPSGSHWGRTRAVEALDCRKRGRRVEVAVDLAAGWWEMRVHTKNAEQPTFGAGPAWTLQGLDEAGEAVANATVSIPGFEVTESARACCYYSS